MDCTDLHLKRWHAFHVGHFRPSKPMANLCKWWCQTCAPENGTDAYKGFKRQPLDESQMTDLINYAKIGYRTNPSLLTVLATWMPFCMHEGARYPKTRPTTLVRDLLVPLTWITKEAVRFVKLWSTSMLHTLLEKLIFSISIERIRQWCYRCQRLERSSSLQVVSRRWLPR